MKVFVALLTLAVALEATQDELDPSTEQRVKDTPAPLAHSCSSCHSPLSGATSPVDKCVDPVKNQLSIFKNKTQGPIGTITMSAGAPVTYDQASSTLNKKLLNNDFFIEILSHTILERTPERAVHALGAGGFGYFKVTHDISHICKADFLKKGEKTPIAVRFSTSAGSSGSSECELDTKGFAVKFYSREGNFDMAGFNTPIFSGSEALKAHAIIHGGRANPATGVPDPTMKWDVLTRMPESLHMMLYVLRGDGIPASYRQMPGWPIHTYQVENKKGETHFIRFKFDPQAGTKNLKAEEAEKMCATDPRHLTKDLYQAIAHGEFPKWDVYVQILTTKDVDKEGSHNVFDSTRILPEDRYPWKKIGEIVLNKNPTNYHAQVESLAFCPCHLVPGILGSPDKLYEARKLIYKTAQFYRLGKNVNSIPVNCPFQVKALHTYNRDGVPPFGNNGGDAPNYYPNSFNGPVPSRENASTVLIDIIEKEAYNLDQSRYLYAHIMTAEERKTVKENLVSICKTVDPVVQKRMVKTFTDINPDLGSCLEKECEFNGINK